MLRQRAFYLGLSFAFSATACWCLFLGCSSKQPIAVVKEAERATGPDWFEDVTDAVGLDFVHDCGPTGDYFMPQTVGSGAAVFDFDGDGLLDIYLLQNAGPNSKSINRLYRQLPGGKFVDATEGSGLGVAGFNMGVAIADVNNDGLPDVLLTQYGGIKLFLNQGGGKFIDITEEAGLSNPLWATSAAFFDYDRDGWLDLVVVNYVEYSSKQACVASNGAKDFCAPKSFQGTSSKLFRNKGSRAAAKGRPQFEDVSLASGIGRVSGPGLGVVCADFDGDGWPDVFVSNDGQPNRLWMNRRDGTFAEEAVSRGVAYTTMGQAYAGMGIALGDVGNRGLFDLYVTHLDTETHTFWKQGPRGLFQDRSAQTGLTAPSMRTTGFGTLMADFDNDGFLDIASVNGRVSRGGSAKDSGLGFWEPYAEKNQILTNDGAGKFRDVSAANGAFCGNWNVGRGVVCADFNDDGAPDLLVTSIGGRARLFRNVAPNRGHWLKARAFDPRLKRDAYGAEVRLRAGDREWLRLANPCQGYLTSGDPSVHFGLGPVDRIDSIVVDWPDGIKEVFDGGPVDRNVELRKGKGRAP